MPRSADRSPDRTVLPAVDGQPGPEIIADHDEAPGSEPIEANRSNGAGAAEPEPRASLHRHRADGAALRTPRSRRCPAANRNRRRTGCSTAGRTRSGRGMRPPATCSTCCCAATTEPSWADLLRFARRVLRGRPGVRRRARDPLWRVLHGLSGADRIPAAPVPTWWQPALGYLSEHRLGPEVFAQPGRIAVTRTHVDVILDLEQIDLAVRISGLDQNPGWVRSLGRIVSFHFEDAAAEPAGDGHPAAAGTARAPGTPS